MIRNFGVIGANGNIGQAIINGNDHYGKDMIPLPVTRSYWENKFGNQLKDLDTIILAVKPRDAISCLDLLRKEISRETKVISIVSGLGFETINQMLGIPYSNIAIMTGNVGIEYGEGIVVYSALGENLSQEIKNLFSPLAKIIERVEPMKIIPHVTIVGSGSALVAQDIWLRHKDSKVDFYEFLKKLDMKNAGVQKFIEVNKIACKEIFGDDSLVESSYSSTLETLKMCCFHPDDVKMHIKKIVTKNGSTEKGINYFDGLDKVTAEDFIKIIARIDAAAKGFEPLIENEFNQWREKNPLKHKCC